MRLLLVSIAALSFACSNSPTKTPGGGGPDASYPSPCPQAAPAAGSSCAGMPPQLVCEYGKDVDVRCNQLVACGGSAWSADGQGDAGLACDPQVEQSCASAYADQQAKGTTGSCAPEGLVCAYPQGTCGCVPPGGKPNVDGGPVTQSAKWTCVDLASGCPFPRPHVGDGCATVDARCDYGGCAGGIVLACTSDHFWAQAPVTCSQ